MTAALQCPRGQRDTNMPEMIARRNTIAVLYRAEPSFDFYLHRLRESNRWLWVKKWDTDSP